MRYKFDTVDDKLMSLYINMVRKIYPEFNPDTQYCLWIVPDFWYDGCLSGVSGQVSLFDEHDALLNDVVIPAFAKQLVRRPYYNKNIRQIGLQRGRNRCFGIPLVFDTLDDLQKIKHVKIRWEMIVPMFLNEWDKKPCEFAMHSLDVVYHLDFDVASENRWFTLSYQDMFFDMCGRDPDHFIEYWDNLTCVSNFEVLCDGTLENSTADTYSIFKLGCRNTVWEDKMFDELSKQDVSGLVTLVQESGKLYDRRVGHSWDLDSYYYEKTVRLTDDLHPDILPEPGFGFK